jgi:trans-2-enoyl-CoA reductase
MLLHRLPVRHTLKFSNRLYSLQSSAVMYTEQGDPNKVLHLTNSSVSDPKDGEVLVQMLASPINPADINMIQGVYPVRPPLPAVGGNEGVGEVLATGVGVQGLKKGDWVVPADSGWGTWRSVATASEADLIRVPNDCHLRTIATMAVTTCTAYRMLKDFEPLVPGDLVIQNGGNSGVGKAVIQLAKHFGLQTLNVVRDRPNMDELEAELKELGATHVVTDVFLRSSRMKDLMKSLPAPKLACNCVGGKATADLVKYLADHGTLVTYGGMSKQPLFIPAGPLIFKDVRLMGFWMTKWNAVKSKDERQAMWDELCALVRQGVLAAPKHRMVPLENFQEAIAKSMDSFTNEKQILDCVQ